MDYIFCKRCSCIQEAELNKSGKVITCKECHKKVPVKKLYLRVCSECGNRLFAHQEVADNLILECSKQHAQERLEAYQQAKKRQEQQQQDWNNAPVYFGRSEYAEPTYFGRSVYTPAQPAEASLDESKPMVISHDFLKDELVYLYPHPEKLPYNSSLIVTEDQAVMYRTGSEVLWFEKGTHPMFMDTRSEQELLDAMRMGESENTYMKLNTQFLFINRKNIRRSFAREIPLGNNAWTFLPTIRYEMKIHNPAELVQGSYDFADGQKTAAELFAQMEQAIMQEVANMLSSYSGQSFSAQDLQPVTANAFSEYNQNLIRENVNQHLASSKKGIRLQSLAVDYQSGRFFVDPQRLNPFQVTQ